MHSLIREPLLHFLLIGLSIFFLYNTQSDNGGDDRRIVINDAIVSSLVQRHQASRKRPPTTAEVRGLIDNYIREEMLFREGVSMGLDRNDNLIRRRVLQKISVLTEESFSKAAATDDELNQYLKMHAVRYAHSATVDFEQVLFDPVRHGGKLDVGISAALKELLAGTDVSTVGDRSLLPSSIIGIDIKRLSTDFGDDFASALQALPVGSWQGPVRSGYGQHLVRVTSHVPGRIATLEDVRVAVARDWENDRRLQASDDYVKELRDFYDIEITAKEQQ